MNKVIYYYLSYPTLNTNIMEQELNHLKDQNSRLHEHINSFESFISDLTVNIMQKCLKKAVQEVRKFSRTPRGKSIQLLSDDYDLNFFDQLCVVCDRGDLDYYPGMDTFINGVCSDIIKELSSDEQYVIYYESIDSYETIDFHYSLKSELIGFLTNYTNAKIREAQEYY